MKIDKKQFLLIIAFEFGLMLFFTGIVFKIKSWPDIFYGIITGSILTLISLISSVFVQVLAKKKGLNLISSNATILFKFHIPIFLINIWFFLLFGILHFFPGEDKTPFIVMLIGVTIIGGSIIATTIRIKSIFIDKQKLLLRIWDYSDVKEISFQQIEKITVFFIYFYFLHYSENGKNKKVKFLPHYFELLNSFGKKTESIIELEGLIDKSKFK